MRTLAFLLSLLAVTHTVWSQGGTVPRTTPPTTVRVLTYNIHHGEGTDGEFNLPRLAQVIASAAPDLVALQEVDEATERSAGVHQMSELARLTGLHPAFGQAMPYQGGAYGVGVLSRWPIISVRNQPLPGPVDSEPRTALSVTVRPRTNTSPITFTSTHLHFGRGEDTRSAQALALNELLAGDGQGLSILGGDMNSGEDSEPLRILRERWSEVVVPGVTALSASGRPGFRLDYLLVRPASRWRVLDGRLLDAPLASDHLAVLALIDLDHP